MQTVVPSARRAWTGGRSVTSCCVITELLTQPVCHVEHAPDRAGVQGPSGVRAGPVGPLAVPVGPGPGGMRSVPLCLLGSVVGFLDDAAGPCRPLELRSRTPSPTMNAWR